jgi:hypothetical protein
VCQIFEKNIFFGVLSNTNGFRNHLSRFPRCFVWKKYGGIDGQFVLLFMCVVCIDAYFLRCRTCWGVITFLHSGTWISYFIKLKNLTGIHYYSVVPRENDIYIYIYIYIHIFYIFRLGMLHMSYVYCQLHSAFWSQGSYGKYTYNWQFIVCPHFHEKFESYSLGFLFH